MAICKQCGRTLHGWTTDFCSDWCRKVWHSFKTSVSQRSGDGQ